MTLVWLPNCLFFPCLKKTQTNQRYVLNKSVVKLILCGLYLMNVESMFKENPGLQGQRKTVLF